jgi:hypothetical protein
MQNGSQFTASYMTALVLANIPSAINTYERLAVWSIQALQNISNGQQVNVLANITPSPTVQCQIAITEDNVPRFILSAYLPVDMAALNSATAKTWMACNDIATAAPNAVFLAN